MDFNQVVNQVDNLHKPFADREDFLKKDHRINSMMLDFGLYAMGGFLVGILLFKGRGPAGFISGATGMWKLRQHIEQQPE